MSLISITLQDENNRSGQNCAGTEESAREGELNITDEVNNTAKKSALIQPSVDGKYTSCKEYVYVNIQMFFKILYCNIYNLVDCTRQEQEERNLFHTGNVPDENDCITEQPLLTTTNGKNYINAITF